MTTLLLRADAGPLAGVGHLARCVAFAEEAVTRGWRVVHSGEIAAGRWFGTRLAELGVPRTPATSTAAALAGHAAELGADLVLVDHYGFGDDLWPAVRDAGARLVSLEDGEFGRRPADVVVDGGLTQGARPDDGSPTVLTGPRFTPLRAVIRDARQRRRRGGGDTAPDGTPPRVVVVLGGGDARAAVIAVLTALRDTGLPMDVRAVASGTIVAPAALPGQRITVDRPRMDLPELFAAADLVVSAAGVQLLELCCIGAPTALVLLADNQAAAYRAVVDRNAVVGLGATTDLIADPSSATRMLRGVLADPAQRAGLAGAASGLVDGLGAGRVLDRALAG